MTRFTLLAAFFASTSMLSADETSVKEMSTAIPEKLPAVCSSSGEVQARPCPPRRNRFGRWMRARADRFRPIPGATAFECGKTRYEPRLADIRELPRQRTLPGWDAGIPETLPSLPFYADGYFQLPVR